MTLALRSQELAPQIARQMHMLCGYAWAPRHLGKRCTKLFATFQFEDRHSDFNNSGKCVLNQLHDLYFSTFGIKQDSIRLADDPRLLKYAWNASAVNMAINSNQIWQEWRKICRLWLKIKLCLTLLDVTPFRWHHVKIFWT